MKNRNIYLLALLFLLSCQTKVLAQGKLLTIDDIYDPVKRVNFSGTPPLDIKWLKDGEHYLLNKRDQQTRTSQLLKVNAATGNAVLFFDQARMEAALLKLPGMSSRGAKE